MSPVATTTPPGTVAAILEAVVRMRHAYELPNIAINYRLTLEELQTLLAGYGYPDKAVMAQRRGEILRDLNHGGETAPEDPTPAPAPVAPSSAESDTPAAGRLATIDVTRLHPDPTNPRDTLTDIEDLADSIKEVGLLQPIVARTDGTRLIVVAGHRRLAALKHLRWATAPVIVVPSMRPDHVLAAMLIENNQRADLDPIEEATAYRRLIDGGLTQQEVAKRVGRSVSTVLNRLALLDLPAEEQDEIRAGVMPVSHVLDRARHQRQQARLRAKGRPVGRPPGVKTKPYFGEDHPLAQTVRHMCSHRGRPKIGKVGCGHCWEQAIRDDAHGTTHQPDELVQA